MSDINSLVAKIAKTIEESPGAYCFDCVGVTSPEDCLLAKRQMKSQLSKLYLIEDGSCGRCHQKKEIVRRR